MLTNLFEPKHAFNDFTNRLFEKWHLGQKERNNGVLLTVFLKEHKIRIEVGYGLEGVLTDAISSDIIRNQIAPAFRENQYEAGLNAAIDSIEKVTRGEYKPVAQSPGPGSYTPFVIFVLFLILSWRISKRQRRRSGIFLPGPGYWGNPWRGGGGFGGSGGGFGGGGGGFSGGGGLSGGGGASGSW